MIRSILDEYAPISLTEMSDVRLMNRIDTKYTTSLSLLPEFLKGLQADYFVQEIDGRRVGAYRTMYLDTPDRKMYLDHHNGRYTRMKIRVRAYLDSQMIFLEIKNKNNKGRTKKKRIQLPEMDGYDCKAAERFLAEYAKYPLENLIPCQENCFLRTTLVNKQKTERLTIDVNLSFRNLSDGTEVHLDDLAIIELKQNGRLSSPAKSRLADLHIYPVSISKYCLGTILTVSEVKNNRFKAKMIQLNKIRKETYGFI
ncbi:MAG: polyphosphate polymerase domain-containing protein [Tannerella sp.]|nr:polyphosphate polymerase domain-containing protein [Tannerella sp.]